MSRVRTRIPLALSACALAAMANIAGGACKAGITLPPPNPTLSDGSYVLTLAAGHGLPALYADSSGRTIRVIADTIIMHPVTTTYEEHATITITPPGGVEQPPSSFVITARSYARSTSQASGFTLPITLYGGLVHGSVQLPTMFTLSLTNGAIWQYERR